MLNPTEEPDLWVSLVAGVLVSCIILYLIWMIF